LAELFPGARTAAPALGRRAALRMRASLRYHADQRRQSHQRHQARSRRETGVFTYNDVAGNEHKISAGRVVDIGPHSKKNEPPDTGK